MRLLTLTLIVGFLFGCLVTSSAYASESIETSPKVVIFIAERLEFADVDEKNTPTLYKLAKENAAGLVALRKAFSYKNISSGFYTTVGSGSTAVGLEPQRGARYTTLETRAKRISELNKNRNTRASFGTLGQAIRDAGLKTAAIGNTSFKEKTNTDFLNTVMDKTGGIDYLSIYHKKVDSQPALDQVNKKTLIKRFRGFYKKSSLIVINFGDLKRLKQLDYQETEKSSTESPKSRADSVLNQMMKVMKKEDLLIVLMPFSKAEIDYGLSSHLIAKGEPLSPIIVRSEGLRGLLKSGTTRRTGVISAGDIVPTVLNHLGVKTKIKYSARRVYTIPFTGDQRTRLVDLSVKAIRHDAFMLPVLIVYVTLSVLVLVSTLIVAAFSRKGYFNNFFTILLVAVFLFPSAINMAAFISLPTLTLTFAFILSLLLIAIPLVLFIKNKLWLMIFVLGIGPVLLVLDTLIRQTIASNSLLSNSLLSGGRYYGLGNQFLGFLFIYTVLFFVFLGSAKPDIVKNRLFKAFAAFMFLFLLIVVGSAGLGANFGGLITLSASLPLTYFRLFTKGRLEKRHVVIFAIIALITILGFTLYDVLQKSPKQSHVASLVDRDLPYVISIIKTKLSHNLEETVLVIYRWGGFLGLSVIIGLLYAGRKRFSEIAAAFPLLRRSLSGIFLAALTAYLYNDTGFEPLMIISLYTLAAFAYLHLATSNEVFNPLSHKAPSVEAEDILDSDLTTKT